MCKGRRGEAGPRPLPRLSTYGAPPRDGGGAYARAKGRTWGREGEGRRGEEIGFGSWKL